MKVKDARREQRRGARILVACKACQAEWPSDPALQVACGECHAGPGERCTWSGPHGYAFHIGRDRQAMRAGYLSACDALTWDGRHSRRQIRVCEPALAASPATLPLQSALL